MYKHLVIDPDRNNLLCSPNLVGMGELVEIYAPDEDTPQQACGKVLRKVKENLFEIHLSYETEGSGNSYAMGEKCVLKVVAKNRSGLLRRRFSKDEKLIVSTEKPKEFTECKVIRAKTGSVRKRRG